MNIATFFPNYGLIILLVVLLAFMFWSSRRRTAKQKLEQEAKARQTVPGAEVLLQGGLYGTIVSYDPDNLDQPAIVELAPGVDIKVHSRAILRVVTPTESVRDRARVHRARGRSPTTSSSALSDPADPDTESGSKPQA